MECKTSASIGKSYSVPYKLHSSHIKASTKSYNDDSKDKRYPCV